MVLRKQLGRKCSNGGGRRTAPTDLRFIEITDPVQDGLNRKSSTFISIPAGPPAMAYHKEYTMSDCESVVAALEFAAKRSREQ